MCKPTDVKFFRARAINTQHNVSISTSEELDRICNSCLFAIQKLQITKPSPFQKRKLEIGNTGSPERKKLENDNATATDEDEILMHRRKRIRSILVERLKKNDEPHSKTEKAAIVLENFIFHHSRHVYNNCKLFCSDESMDANENKTSAEKMLLEPALKAFMAKLLERQKKKDQKQHLSRRAMLRRAIGNEERFQRICLTVAKVQKLRWCPPDFCSGNQGKHLIPDEMRTLFFNTPLVSAYEYIPADSFPKLPWKAMLEQAEQNLSDYEVWKTKLLS